MAEKRKSNLEHYFKPLKALKPSGSSDPTAESSDQNNCNGQEETEREIFSEITYEEYQQPPSSSKPNSVEFPAPAPIISGNTGNSDMDIALFKSKCMTDDEKLKVLCNKWTPNSNFNFPLRPYGNQKRKFLFSWLNKYPWLCYSGLEDSAYCIHCMLFACNAVGKSSAQETGQLVKVGFCNWKKALEKFENHSKSQYHKDAAINAINFKRVMDEKLKPINITLDKGKDIQAQNNAEKLIPIIDTIILCGRQNIALRGHRDYGEFNINSKPIDNEGNFRALLRARIEAGDVVLKNHFLSCGKNATYISWDIQNQVIEACNQIIQSKISDQVKEAKFFSVLADETTDISTTEQFSLCLRYVIFHEESKEYKMCEQFLKFMPLTSTTGCDLAKSLVKGLEESDIDINNLRGQGYDGAAAMSGKFKGVQAYIQEHHPTALYVHCASHSLNLALSNATEVTSIRNCFGTIEKVYVFFNSPKRQTVLQNYVISLAKDVNKKKLQQLCPTRWVQRHDAVFVMKELLQPVAAALEEIKAWSDREASSGANILLNAISQSDFLVSLFCSEKLLSYTIKLCKKLQGTDEDLSSAISHAEVVVERIKTLRGNSDQEFNVLFKEASECADYLGTTIAMPRIVGRQTNRNNTPAETAEEYYRRSVFLPWVDSFIGAIDSRFLKHKEILSSFQCLLPSPEKASSKKIGVVKTTEPLKDSGCEFGEEEKNIDEEATPKVKREMAFLKLCKTYNQDIESESDNALKAELELWHDSFKSRTYHPKKAIDALNLCDKDLFPNIYVLLKIFCTIPVSTSTAERSFSTLRRIKTYLRNSMGENRLSGLASLNIHREIEVSSKAVLSVLRKSARRLDFVL